MTYEQLLGLALFAFVSSITPGPNNLMLMASGANFGFVRTVPHMLGIGIGFTLMVIVVGFGLMEIFDTYPVTHTALLVVGSTYMIWLAWKIANAAAPESQTSSEGRPLTFLQAALFQWVNVKAWSMAVTALALYAPSQDLWAVLLVAVIFGAINLPSVSTWTVLGLQLRRWLASPLRLRVFNVTMALLLVASLGLVFVS